MARRIERYDADGKGYPSGGDKFERYDADGKPMTIGGGGGGDVSTASNVGGGAEWFKDLTATVLRFRTFISSHLGLVITQNANDITIDLDESAVDHNSLANLTVGDPHTQYVLDSDTTATPTASKIPIADGSNKLAAGWISEVLQLTDLAGVVITAAAQGDIFIRNATAWVNTNIPVESIVGRLTGGDVGPITSSASTMLARLASGGVVWATVSQIKTLLAIATSDIVSGILALVRGGTGADLSGTGPGFLKQATIGANVTVAALSSGDIPDISATYIPNALINAKGDIIAASADNTPAIRSVGTNGQALVADSGQSSGLNWADRASVARIDVYTADDTWSKPTGAKAVEVILMGGGGGGGSGRKGNTNTSRRGGSGGGGGQMARHVFSASLIASSVAVDVGAAGTGGAAQTTASTNGNPGTDGGSTSFGSTPYLKAGGGKGGPGGTAATNAGGQGGTAWDGTNQTAGDGQYGGGGIGANGGDGLTGGGAAEFGGGGGGGAAPLATSLDGGGSVHGAAGGAAGGGTTGANNTLLGGGAAGAGQSYAVGTGSAGGASGSPGGNGTPGGNYSATYAYSGGGGGGGGGGSNGVGGDGASGGNYGGGGGGGGNGTGANNSGKGGDAAGGFAIIITYF